MCMFNGFWIVPSGECSTSWERMYLVCSENFIPYFSTSLFREDPASHPTPNLPTPPDPPSTPHPNNTLLN